MRQLIAYIKIIRVYNSLMAGCAVLLGYWLSKSELPKISILFLFLSAFVSTGFGNVINDIRDISSDKISHPNRPLPQGEISVPMAWIYCSLLVFIGIFCSFSVSFTHGIATVIPLIILTLYAYFFKGTPIVGNVVVASLVAYAILFGAIHAVDFTNLIIPAGLAFFLNFSREIIKDIQDEDGDRATSVVTSATLPYSFLKALIYLCTVIYLSLLFVPALSGTFGIIYTCICITLILPIHFYRTSLLISQEWKSSLLIISKLFKLEMICGLLSLAADRFFSHFQA